MAGFDLIFQTLQATGVRYVVVGGVAVNLHGYQRFTKDVDLIIELVPKESLRALEALQAIDIFTSCPLDFDSLWNEAVEIKLTGANPRIASIDHLILMKNQAGRAQDIADIDALQKIKQIVATRGHG
jgi:predicted nucleotidyltransferase